MNILVLGDSTSFGAELPDLPAVEFRKHGNDYVDADSVHRFAEPSQLAWPALLGKKLRASTINHSMIGGSNDRIFRLAITETLNQTWDLVICAWTNIDRFDLTDGQYDLALSMANHWGYNWIKDYVHNHFDLHRQQINLVTKLVALQSYFNQKNQRFVFVKSTAMMFSDDVNQLLKTVDTKHWIDWNSHFYQWAKDAPKGKNNHLLEHGHNIVADKLCQHIVELYPDLKITL